VNGHDYFLAFDIPSSCQRRTFHGLQGREPSSGFLCRGDGYPLRRVPSFRTRRFPPAQLSTDMQVDSQHQVYYEFVDDSTGNVLFEIPPEALREIGESLNVPLDGDFGGHDVDVTS
jgi:hypothetical protein